MDNNESLEELDFVPSAVNESADWHEPLRVKYMCGKKFNEEGSKFHEIASILMEGDGKPISNNATTSDGQRGTNQR